MYVLCVQFDAIVIGGGPAGSVVSKLLSDDPWRKVLLIEAGDASQAELGGKVRFVYLRRFIVNGLFACTGCLVRGVQAFVCHMMLKLL